MRVGDPDGYGRYGILDGDDERVACHECGKMYRSLGSHVWIAHELSADEYRRRHGIPQRVGLVSPSLSRSYSERSVRNLETEGWQRMVEKRDPLAASRARSGDAFRRRGGDVARHLATSKANIAGVRKPVTRRCQVCGALIDPVRKGNKSCSALCSRILKYESGSNGHGAEWLALRDKGESWSAIGRLYGVSHTAVRGSVRTYRRYLSDRAFLDDFGPGDVPEVRKQDNYPR